MMISNAKKSIHLITPYFIPDPILIMALKNAAMSGLDVKIILPSRFEHDYTIPFYASRTYFEELLDAGVKIYVYRKGFIHAKTIITDSKTATLGTTNFDIRSLQLNFDVNLVLYSEEDVLKIEKYFSESLERARKIDAYRFKKRRIHRRIRESVCRLLSPIL